MLFYYIEVNDGKSRIDLNAVEVLRDIVSADISLRSQAYFYTELILSDAIVVNLQLKLLPYAMNANRVLRYPVLNHFRCVVPNPPYQYPPFVVLSHHRVLNLQLPQLTNNPYGLFLGMPLHLTVPHNHVALLFHTNSRNHRRTGLHQIIQRQYTILNHHPPLLQHHYRILYLRKRHPIHILMLKFLYLQ